MNILEKLKSIRGEKLDTEQAKCGVSWIVRVAQAVAALVVLGLIIWALLPSKPENPAPVVVEKEVAVTVEVEKPVVQTVVVEKEVMVTSESPTNTPVPPTTTPLPTDTLLPTPMPPTAIPVSEVSTSGSGENRCCLEGKLIDSRKFCCFNCWEIDSNDNRRLNCIFEFEGRSDGVSWDWLDSQSTYWTTDCSQLCEVF